MPIPRPPRQRHSVCHALAWAVWALATPAAMAQPLVAHGAPPGEALALRVSAGTVQMQGLSPENLLIALRRRQLPHAAQLECSALDTQLPVLARNLHRAAPADKAAAQAALEQAQARFRALRC